MMNVLFLGMTCLLVSAASFWIFGRGTPRPVGTWAMGALLVSFAVAFTSYAPIFENAVEAVVPHVARLLSNSASLAAATSVLAVSFQINLEPDEACRRIRVRLALLGGAVLRMTLLFAVEEATHRSPQIYALYLLVYVTYLSWAVVDFLGQAIRQSKATRRSSVRLGMRIATAGCVFALIYTVYKLARLITLGLGVHLFPNQTKCTTLLSSPCVFSVSAPAVAVLLICVGLTLPAVVYPITLARHRRWEHRSLVALEPLWNDLTTEMPNIVLPTTENDKEDVAFLLQRRVIEISDGMLALRPYRSRAVQEAARSEFSRDAAWVEAVVVQSALAAHRTNSLPAQVAGLPSANGQARRGDLRAETEWLLAIADAYARTPASRVTDDGRLEWVGA